MDSGISACSQGPNVEASGSTHYRIASVANGLEGHPFWSSAETKGLKNPPPYTDGPSRVILANDGTKDCLALLLTPDLVAALNQVTHDIRQLERKDGALENIESELDDLASKSDDVEETIRNPRYQDRVEEMQLALEILQLKHQEAEERKKQLKTALVPFEINPKISTYQSQGILEEALLEACLLDPPEPESPPICHDADDDISTASYSGAPGTYERSLQPAPEQQSLHQARMDAIRSYETLRTYQDRFDGRHADYERKLADFQRVEARSEGTRTRFDHRHIRHVQNLTRDLSAAEQGYKIAKAKARTLEMLADPGLDFGCVADGGDRRSEDESSESDVDRGRVEAWMRGVVPGCAVEVVRKKEPLDLDEWTARPVDIMDSISVIGREEYVDEIKEWKKHCRVLRGEAATGFQG